MAGLGGAAAAAGAGGGRLKRRKKKRKAFCFCFAFAFAGNKMMAASACNTMFGRADTHSEIDQTKLGRSEGFLKHGEEERWAVDFVAWLDDALVQENSRLQHLASDGPFPTNRTDDGAWSCSSTSTSSGVESELSTAFGLNESDHQSINYTTCSPIHLQDTPKRGSSSLSNERTGTNGKNYELVPSKKRTDALLARVKKLVRMWAAEVSGGEERGC